MNRNESETRAELIDPKLVLDGWGVIDNSIIRRELSITAGRILGGGKRSSKLSADYVLEFQGRKLATVEAKRESLRASIRSFAKTGARGIRFKSARMHSFQRCQWRP